MNRLTLRAVSIVLTVCVGTDPLCLAASPTNHTPHLQTAPLQALVTSQAFTARATHFLNFWSDPTPKISAAQTENSGFQPLKPLLGGASTIAGDLTFAQREQVRLIIATNPKQVREADVSKFAHLNPALAARVQKAKVFVVAALAETDPFLMAHAGAGGELVDSEALAVYFSPGRFDLLAQLSAEAQMEFWAHELYHLDHPYASEPEVAQEFPLKLVRLEVAALLMERIPKDFALAEKILSELDDHLLKIKQLVRMDARTLLNKVLNGSTLENEANRLRGTKHYDDVLALFKKAKGKYPPDRASLATRQRVEALLLLDLYDTGLRELDIASDDRAYILGSLYRTKAILTSYHVQARDASIQQIYGVRPALKPDEMRVDLEKRISAERKMVLVRGILKSLVAKAENDLTILDTKFSLLRAKGKKPDYSELGAPKMRAKVLHELQRVAHHPTMDATHFAEALARAIDENHKHTGRAFLAKPEMVLLMELVPPAILVPYGATRPDQLDREPHPFSRWHLERYGILGRFARTYLELALESLPDKARGLVESDLNKARAYFQDGDRVGNGRAKLVFRTRTQELKYLRDLLVLFNSRDDAYKKIGLLLLALDHLPRPVFASLAKTVDRDPRLQNIVAALPAQFPVSIAMRDQFIGRLRSHYSLKEGDFDPLEALQVMFPSAEHSTALKTEEPVRALSPELEELVHSDLFKMTPELREFVQQRPAEAIFSQVGHPVAVDSSRINIGFKLQKILLFMKVAYETPIIVRAERANSSELARIHLGLPHLATPIVLERTGALTWRAHFESWEDVHGEPKTIDSVVESLGNSTQILNNRARGITAAAIGGIIVQTGSDSMEGIGTLWPVLGLMGGLLGVGLVVGYVLLRRGSGIQTTAHPRRQGFSRWSGQAA